MMSVTVGILLANLLLLSLLTVAGWQSRTTPGARAFTALQLLSAVWVAVTVLGVSMDPGPARLRIWGVTVGVSLIVTTLWMGFILSYTGREEWLRPRCLGVFAAPLGVGAALYAVAPSWSPLVNTTHQALTPAGTLVRASIGPVGAALGLYLYAVFLVGLIVVVRTALIETRVFTGQLTALVLGTLVTVGASGARVLELVPLAGYPTTQVALGAQSLLWGYAVLSQNFLGQVPAIGRIGERTIFENIDDGVLVTNDTGVVVKSNPQAARLFDCSDVVGSRIVSLFSEIGVDPTALPQQFRRGGRTYYLTSSTMTDWHDDVIGRAYVLRDVTDLIQRQQRLSVLNRVLRHNVRNEVTVIRGSASSVATWDDADVSDLGRRIVDHADRLSRISERARELEGVLDGETSEVIVDPDTLLTDVVESVTAETDVESVTVSAEASPFEADRTALSLVLEEAVENALTHAGSDPTVTVSIRERDSDVEFVVRDDGPGIPDSELEPIRSGGETKLAHGTGLGLWLINWATRSLGGFVRFETDDGTTVRLLVPVDTDQVTTTRTDVDLLDSTASPAIPEPQTDATGDD